MPARSSAKKRTEQLVDDARQALDLSMEARVAFVRTPRWIRYTLANHVLERLEWCFTQPRDGRIQHVLIVGEPNNGKSTLLKHFCAQHPPEDNPEGEHIMVPVGRIETPAAADEARLYAEIMTAYHAQRKSSNKIEDKVSAAHSTLKLAETRMLCMDEIHNYSSPALPTVSQGETKQFDPRFGAVTQLTGPNALVTQWTIDEFGRVTEELRADGTRTVSFYCYLSGVSLDTSSNTPSCPVPTAGEAPTDAVYFVHSEPRDTANVKMGAYSRAYTDRLGRTLRTVTESFDGAAQPSGAGNRIVKDAQYNQYGAKIIETQPYFIGNGSSTTGGSNDYGMALTNTDVLGRAIEVFVADPRGSQASVSFAGRGSRPAARSQMTYAGLRVTTTNDLGQQQIQEKSVDGKVIRVTDPAGGQTVRQYDAFDNLVLTRDALQNVITTSFDIRGRKTQMNDPDSGLWMYDYNALGELVWQQSPNQRAAALPAAQQTTMAYDLLGRMIQRVEPEYTSTWSYDKYADASACSKGIGKLCEVVTTNGIARKHVYDSLGRPSSSRTTVTSGPSFASALTYNATTGRLATQTYPTGLKVNYTYTTKGFVEKLTLATAATVNPLPATVGGAPGSSANLAAGSLLWQAQIVNALGQTESTIRGNNVVSRTAIEAATGRATSLTAGIGAATNVLNYAYTWDSLNNLKTRADANGDGSTGAVTETFAYDTLNRLVDYTVASAAISGLSRKVTLHYNAIGNILYKSDLGVYDTTGTRPHATIQMAGAATTNYTFDANGNVITASGGKYRNLTYTSFNLPDSQTGVRGPSNSPQYLWQYDAEHQRFKETRIAGSTRVTWMLHPNNTGGLSFESETNSPVGGSPTTSNRHYLAVGGETVGVLVQMAALPTLSAGVTTPPSIANITLVKVEYWHRDHLGSLATTTDHAGAVTARYEYDPFGQRREANGVYDRNGTLLIDFTTNTNKGTDRGFTGHEHLDDIGLVHMNGRLYDPQLGRFLQADPFIQDIDNLQAFNRFSYCYGNPLNCTDPSGYFSLKKFFKKYRSYIAIAVAIALAPGTGGASVAAMFSGLGEAAVIAQTAFAGFASGAVASGSFKGAVQGAFFAVAFYGVGEITGLSGGRAFSVENIVANPGQFAGAVAAHSIVGCAQSVVGGGKCGPGALSAAFSKMASPITGPLAESREWTGIVAGTVVSAVIGGTAAELGGGKFSNGATTAAFGYLFNQVGHLGEQESSPGQDQLKKMHAAGVRASETGEMVVEEVGWFAAGSVGGRILGGVAKFFGLGSRVALDEARLGHVFRNAEGHLLDTPANRSLLVDVANMRSARLGPDDFGNTWNAVTRADGTQVWVQIRNDRIINGGVNATPRTFNPQTGLSSPTKP